MPQVHGIQFDELGRLGVDENNQLYWDGRPLITEERLSLAWWVNVSAVATGLSTLTLAAIEVLKFFGRASG